MSANVNLTQEEMDALLENVESGELDIDELAEEIKRAKVTHRDKAILLEEILGYNQVTATRKQDGKYGYLIANNVSIKIPLNEVYFFNRYLLRYACKLGLTFVVFTNKDKYEVSHKDESLLE